MLCEQLVKRKTSSMDWLIRFWVVVLVLFFFLLSFAVGKVCMVIATLLGLIAWLLIFPRLHVEYEYVLVNQMFTIDIIYNQTKRKNLCSIEANQIEMLALQSSESLNSYCKLKCDDYTSKEKGSKPMILVYKQYGQEKALAFEPEEELLNRLKTIERGKRYEI